jgi:hypothetical protein
MKKRALGTFGVETAHHQTPLPSQQLHTAIQYSNTTGEFTKLGTGTKSLRDIIIMGSYPAASFSVRQIVYYDLPDWSYEHFCGLD